MTYHDDVAAERDLAADFAEQDLEDTARQKGQGPPGCLGAHDGRRKALDGSPLGEPALDWSGINVSTAWDVAPVTARAEAGSWWDRGEADP